ncbi:MAG: methionine--tRNA ligase [Lachnospiraceae bacterium]|jgi:methionyl-tRNA synthetase|nr:methionine--tRNA ligase [Lachnospiraceae bacterium]
MVNKRIRNDERPVFPKRALITGGMPYGNKTLHFGHVGGMFVHADTFARFLRDRIGKENVLFVSGTDCYGSPIVEAYRKLCDEGYSKSMEDYVMGNHEKQKKTLKDYEISLDIFGASAFGETGKMHKQVSKEVFDKLYENGHLAKMSTPQFYDPVKKMFVNGRQVVGKCPIEGCCSEKGYADECDLGHQYSPSELIDPISTLSGVKPEIRPVTNWYFTLEDCMDMLSERMQFLTRNSNTRKFEIKAMEEFLKDPCIYVQKKQMDDMESLEAAFPEHETINEEKKPSVTFIFKNLDGRDKAREILDEKGIHYRTGKTLVPFRLSGNIDWGVPVPDKEDVEGLTFWVWPESLWAPVSFSRTYFKEHGFDDDEWKRWWLDEDACVYQFIGQDNIYFYGLAEMGMFVGLNHKKGEQVDMEKEVLPHIVANNHILFMDKKASSSSALKPPMADELLDYYSAEQLRIHFLSLGLASKSVGFKPQVYLPKEEREGADPVLKEGNLLTNVFNRLVRSCFYSTQQYYNGIMPTGQVDEKILNICKDAILEYERHMYNHEFHRVTYVLDSLIRDINKHWVNNIKVAEKNDDEAMRKQLLVDCFYGVKVITTLLHPIAPSGCEMVQEYLKVDDRLFNWDYIFEPITVLTEENHELKFLEPKVDFFKKPACQFEQEA